MIERTTLLADEEFSTMLDELEIIGDAMSELLDVPREDAACVEISMTPFAKGKKKIIIPGWT